MSRVIYIDDKSMAHVANVEGYTPVTVDMLDGFCDQYIEGLMVVPDGKTAKHPDGRILAGFTVAPVKNSIELDKAQREYERQRAAELEEENAALLADMAQLVEEVYRSDLEMMTE